MWTKAFWKQTVERAVKTFAQGVLAFLAAGYTGVTTAPWLDAFDVGGLAFVLSVLTSLVSALSTNDGEAVTPSLVSLNEPPETASSAPE